jgi:deoxyribose-phosphate aldolase
LSGAAIALRCLDLTSLGEDDTPARAAELARRAATPFGPPAALCVYPELILAARIGLARAGIAEVAVATVVNFPDGAADPLRVERETRRALAAGADEIDLVFPWRAFMAGDQMLVMDVVQAAVARCAGRAVLKLILESGAFADSGALRAAAELGIAAGADFLKTSTGKTDIGATPAAARILLQAIADSGRAIGFKVSGGVRALSEALAYIALVRQYLGDAALQPARFRVGASALLDDVLQSLAHERADADRP